MGLIVFRNGSSNQVCFSPLSPLLILLLSLQGQVISL